MAALSGCSADNSGGPGGGDDGGGVGGGGGDGGVVGGGGDGGGVGHSDGGGGGNTDGNMMMTGGFGTIFTILLENHSYGTIVGNTTDAPYINGLINQYGLATNYKDSGTHPSLPNYLYMISGDTQYFGLIDLDPTSYPFPVDKDNLGHQLTAANIPWRSYQESAEGTCVLATHTDAKGGNYAPKHNPFLYFTDIQKDANGLCAQTSVDYSSFAADLAAGTYKYMFITPNLGDDGHDPNSNATDVAAALKNSDTWLSNELPKILGSAAYQNNGIVFLTWDEGESSADYDHVPMIIISPKLKSAKYQSAAAYTHASYLATVEDVFGLPRLGAAAQATPLSEFFQ